MEKTPEPIVVLHPQLAPKEHAQSAIAEPSGMFSPLRIGKGLSLVIEPCSAENPPGTVEQHDTRNQRGVRLWILPVRLPIVGRTPRYSLHGSRLFATNSGGRASSRLIVALLPPEGKSSPDVLPSLATSSRFLKGHPSQLPLEQLRSHPCNTPPYTDPTLHMETTALVSPTDSPESLQGPQPCRPLGASGRKHWP